jgi:hypothetical protein
VSLKSLRKRNIPKSLNHGHGQGRYMEVLDMREDEHVVVRPFFKLVPVFEFQAARGVVVDWRVVDSIWR